MGRVSEPHRGEHLFAVVSFTPERAGACTISCPAANNRRGYETMSSCGMSWGCGSFAADAGDNCGAQNMDEEIRHGADAASHDEQRRDRSRAQRLRHVGMPPARPTAFLVTHPAASYGSRVFFLVSASFWQSTSSFSAYIRCIFASALWSFIFDPPTFDGIARSRLARRRPGTRLPCSCPCSTGPLLVGDWNCIGTMCPRRHICLAVGLARMSGDFPLRKVSNTHTLLCTLTASQSNFTSSLHSQIFAGLLCVCSFCSDNPHRRLSRRRPLCTSRSPTPLFRSSSRH